ncbi:MAG: PEPxxWA-CTERM sorting domain-containing protein [Caulobacteraceae bacterium]
MRNSILVGVAAMMGLVASAAGAAQLTVTSYDMPNGDGQASGGTYNYWDGAYTGAGSHTTDGAALSGGLGKLTDGVISTQPWYLVSNVAGTGDYVGWLLDPTPNPTVTFHFAGSQMINDVRVQLDNTGVGGVYAPGAIFIDGVNESFTPPALGSVGVVDISGLNFTGATHTVQFFQQASTWTFVSEVSFFGAPGGVPEPGAWTLMLVGFGLIGYTLRGFAASNRRLEAMSEPDA